MTYVMLTTFIHKRITDFNQSHIKSQSPFNVENVLQEMILVLNAI